MFLYIDSTINFFINSLDPKIVREIKSSCTFSNPKFYKNKRLGFSVYNVPSKIKCFYEDRHKFYFSRGLLDTIIEILNKYKVNFKIIDNTYFSDKFINFNLDNIKLRDDQLDIYNCAMRSNFGGFIKADTSVGKTITSLYIGCSLGQVFGIIVWSTVHQEQWIKEIRKFGIVEDKYIGGLGGLFKKPVLGKINIVMQQSLKNDKNLNFFKDISCWFAEESQRYAASSFYGICQKLRAKYRFAISASNKRSDGMKFMIDAAFGSKLYDSAESDKTVDSKIKCSVLVAHSKYVDDIFMEEMAFGEINYSDFINRLSINKSRNKFIAKICRGFIKRKKLILIMVDRKSHVISLRRELKEFRLGYIMGSTSKKDIISMENLDINLSNEEKDFLINFDDKNSLSKYAELARNRELDIIVGTSKVFVGFNVKTIDVGIITTPCAKNIELFNQKVGRVERSYYRDNYLLNKFGKKSKPYTVYISDSQMYKFKRDTDDLINKYPRKFKNMRFK